ncbi:hypothetical protein ACHAW6_010441 [Cyclotella cf. meneghiniana]
MQVRECIRGRKRFVIKYAEIKKHWRDKHTRTFVHGITTATRDEHSISIAAFCKPTTKEEWCLGILGSVRYRSSPPMWKKSYCNMNVGKDHIDLTFCQMLLYSSGPS